MYKEAFLDRAQSTKVQLIKTLFVHGGKLTSPKLITLMSLHEKTIRRTIDQLNIDSNQLWEQEIIGYYSHEDSYYLRDFNHNLDELIYDYLATAINVQIIDLLINHPQQSTVQILQHLFLSKTEYYKRIQHLNQLLAAFDIQIERNTLKGSISALNFFMYQFYTRVSPQKALYDRVLTPHAQHYLQQLTTHLNVHWSTEIKQTLDLWISLSWRARKQQLATDICSFENDPTLKDIFAFFRDHFAEKEFLIYVGGDSEDGLLFYALFILFCLSQGFLLADHPLIKRYMQKIAEDENSLYQGIRLFLEKLGYDARLLGTEESQWYLYARLLGYAYYKGTIFYWDEATVEHYTAYNYQREEIEQQLIAVAEQTSLEHTYLVANREFVSHMVYQFVYRHFQSFQKPFKIGVFLAEFYPALQETFCHHVESELLKAILVHVEPYESHKKYDLIISNFQSSTFPANTPVCYITNLGNDQEGWRVYEYVKQGIQRSKQE